MSCYCKLILLNVLTSCSDVDSFLKLSCHYLNDSIRHKLLNLLIILVFEIIFVPASCIFFQRKFLLFPGFLMTIINRMLRLTPALYPKMLVKFHGVLVRNPVSANQFILAYILSLSQPFHFRSSDCLTCIYEKR